MWKSYPIIPQYMLLSTRLSHAHSTHLYLALSSYRYNLSIEEVPKFAAEMPEWVCEALGGLAGTCGTLLANVTYFFIRLSGLDDPRKGRAIKRKVNPAFYL